MSSKVWQHPYVNVFKHLKLEEWKRASKEGDVSTYMDKTLKCSVFRIRGSIPASNYILLPKTSSQSLGLTGRYLYLLFRPSPNKHFVVHVDVAAEEGQVIRVSFSNLFKEFKSTATWLQFPFLCGAAPDSVYASTAKTTKHGLVGPAPVCVRWTCLMMDLRYMLSVYLNRTHSHLKSIKLCANMAIKNIMTSDLLLDPGLSFSEFRQAGMVLPEGTAPMPREMCFPVPKGSSWHGLYDYIRFPSDGVKMPFDSIQKGISNPSPKETVVDESPHREESCSVNISKPVQDRVSLIQQITTSKPRAKQRSLLLTSSLPDLTSTHSGESLQSPSQRSQAKEGRGLCDDEESVHVYAHYEEDDGNTNSTDSEEVAVVNAPVPRPLPLPSVKQAKQQQKLHPDPIMKLSRIIGFGGATTRCAIWATEGEEVVYPCHALIVSMKVSSGQQRFFIGHTDKVSALALNSSSSLLASAQTGTHCLVRFWSYCSGQCLTLIKTHTHSLCTLSFSYSGSVLCGVGRDKHNKTMVVVWNTQHVTKGGPVTVMAKAHTDVDIQTMKIAFFDDTRMVSCGVSNVRLWRVRGGSLRSCPVNLGQYHNLEFTDLAFEQGHTPDRHPDDRTLFASSKSGHILDIDYVSVAIKNVRRLLPAQQSHSHRREKQTFNTGPGISVNSISVCGSFCATGSEDGFLRLWPLDFSSVLLEAEHEGPVSLVNVASDGLSVLAATSTGNLGYLDVSSRGYRTLMRSHTATVLGFSVDGIRRQITTASRDCTVRVWDMDSTQQLYDFVSDEDDDAPCSVAFHPSLPVFACGSSSGTLRVFDIPTSSLLAQHRQHRGAVVGLVFSPDGEHMYSAGSLGNLALYKASEPEYHIVRVLGNVVAKGTDRGPDALAVSSDSRCLAFVGPSEYTVTIMDAHSLDELLRIDVSVLDIESTTLDSALKVCFSPSSLSHLLITTSANKILWVNRNTGRLLREVGEVHKHQCASLAVSEDGRYLLTAGHNAVKVWDYNMKLDINSQVFIGHSEPIAQVCFTPDQMGVLSVGDAIFFWEFLAHPQMPTFSPSSPSAVTSPCKASKGLVGSLSRAAVSAEQCEEGFNGMPRQAAPRPSSSLPILNASSLGKAGHGASSLLSLGDDGDDEEFQSGPTHSPAPRHASFLRVTERLPAEDSVTFLTNQIGMEENKEDLKADCPDCYKHFTPRYKTSVMNPSAITPPPGQEGLTLKAVVGYNGNGRNNMAWNPDTGLFVYSCGCVVVVENLHTGSQRHWLGHSEEISTLVVTHDAQMVASASVGGTKSKSLICIWNVQDGSRRNSISYHKGSVQSLAFSRDDLYLLSMGDFVESVVALWSTHSFELLCAVSVDVPLHEGAFCPSSASQLAFTGSNAVFFCHIHTRGSGAELQVQKVAVPEKIGEAEVTSLCYNTNSALFTGTNSGLVCVWDCNPRRCFMTWEADEGEIGVLLCRGNRVVTGSNSKKLRLWSTAAVQKLRPSNSEMTVQQGRNAQVLLEQEMLLDGTVVSAAFDDVMDMGIVGTTAGTLWYINWADNTSIRLISGHKSKVNSVVCSPDERNFVTCGQDGSVRVWALPSNELLVQFQVLNQSCECVCWSRPVEACESGVGVCVAGGYSDGSVRIFSVETAEMELKLQPHRVSVCALQYSHHGADLECKDGRGWTALLHSTSTGHPQMVKFLLDNNANANVKVPVLGFTPLMEAAASGHEIIVQYLLDHGARVEERNFKGETARVLSMMYGHAKIASLIDMHCMRVKQGLYEELSSSEEDSAAPRARSTRSRARGPSIHDGPQAIARFRVGPKHDFPSAPPGYVTFRDVGDQNESICNRDVTSPINELDGQSNSSRDELLFDNDTPTIRSSSSSEGLPRLLGLSREGSLESNEDSDQAKRSCPRRANKLHHSKGKSRHSNSDSTPPSGMGNCGIPPPYTGPKDLAEFLEQIGFSKYLPLLEEQDIDLRIFLTLTENDLKEVGITLFGPKRKMASAIARWQSNARPPSDALEQAYADKLEAKMQEMAIQLHKCCVEVESLQGQVSQEKELRTVMEGCLMEEKMAWRNVQAELRESVKQIHALNAALHTLRNTRSQVPLLIRDDGQATAKESTARSQLLTNVECFEEKIAEGLKVLCQSLEHLVTPEKSSSSWQEES